jgi:hypothetical protein
MKLLQKLIIVILFVLWPTLSSAQNWMMAQHYMTLAIDSLIQINFPNTGKLAGYKISYIEFDEIYEDYRVQFMDSISCSKLDMPIKDGEEPDIVVQKGELVVSLSGGEATYEDENGEITYLELPDLSQVVYIFNEVGTEISFSLSNDDKSFETIALQAEQFYYFPCFASEYAYIKILTMVDGTETGNVHYKLEKAKGYKVKYDTANSKFEVYLDERMDIEDFK